MLRHCFNILVLIHHLSSFPGNSNSVTHLIENEIPLAHISSNEMATFALDTTGGVLMDNGGMMPIQRSDSYSNLYPEEELTQQNQTMDGGGVEGHYSNLPQLSAPETSGFGGIRGSIEELVDADALAAAQQHVYSNINGNGEPATLDSVQELEAAREEASALNGSALSWRDTSSSTLMADDMDLDDLSTVATAFQGKARTKKSAGSKGRGEKMNSDSSVSSAASSRRPPELTSTPVRVSGKGGGHSKKQHIIPIVAVIETSNNVNNVLNCPSGGELQMLHDTTMIDCALDLDSLDTVTNQGPQK